MKKAIFARTFLGSVFAAFNFSIGNAIASEFVKVSGDVYYYQDKNNHLGGVAAHLGPKGFTLIDSQNQKTAPIIYSALKKLGTSPIKYLINTHWHPDHAKGNLFFAEKGAEVLSHWKAKERMASEQHIDFFDYRVAPLAPKALPKRTLRHSGVLSLGNEKIMLLHTPRAHTDGDIFIYFRDANVIHAGDLFFKGVYPFIDYSTGGTVKGMIEALRKVLSYSDRQTKIIAGHGGIGVEADIDSQIELLGLMSARVEGLLCEGLTNDEIVARRPSAEFDAKWSWDVIPPDRFVYMMTKALRMTFRRDLSCRN